MKKSIIITSIILTIAAIVAVFELHPAVKDARWYVSPENKVSKTCDCECILDGVPWYGSFNYWFWLWFVGVPAILFQIKPTYSNKRKGITVVSTIAICYVLMNLALHLMWDISNAPFRGDPDGLDGFMQKCANTSDGASLVFTLFFGWIYATIYTGWWLIAWKHYHLKYSKTIIPDYKYDKMSSIAVNTSVILPLIPTIYIAFISFGFLISWILEKLGLLETIKTIIF
ncbi:MAG: hypothetical protein GY804_03570 [Alphaproteobacteria bacterium]|nr:hypothetical protein [Alphaproteobacteria bacterium]